MPSSYDERTGVGKVVVSYLPKKVQVDLLRAEHEHIPARNDKHRCLISLDFPTNVTQAYRHMFTTLEERARILDDHLTSMGEDVVDVLRTSQGDQGAAELEALRLGNLVCTTLRKLDE